MRVDLCETFSLTRTLFLKMSLVSKYTLSHDCPKGTVHFNTNCFLYFYVHTEFMNQGALWGICKQTQVIIIFQYLRCSFLFTNLHS